MEIPAPLKSAVENGSAVLMLGAGASLAARDADGNAPPTTDKLGEILCDRFLTPKHKKLPLTQVADFSISESSVGEVQEYIREIFLPFQPSDAHLLIPSFRWRAIVTTNYDCLVEDAYARHKNPIQRVVPLHRSTDRWDDDMQDPGVVPLLKLHGCITRTHDTDCPLIISTEQYLSFEQGRSRLFRLFQEIASERPLIYIGSSNTDPDIRALVQQLDTENVGRPRSYLVTPSVDDIAQRHWSQRQITAIAATFEDAMTAIDEAVPANFRGLRKPAAVGSMAIADKFTHTDVQLGDTTLKALSLDLEYVKGAAPEHPADPRRFYSGISYSWQPIIQELDVRRRLHDTVLTDYFLDDDPGRFRFLVIKAHAGAGKSVFLRRIAWEAAHELNRLCLYADPDASLSSVVLQEIHEATREHVYLFVEDLVRHRNELTSLCKALGSAADWLTIIGGVRTNEWNGASPSFQSLATNEHLLPYLSANEIDKLISKLEEHNALDEMEHLDADARRDALQQRAGRQLLVALHEATSGARFEEILHDEYSRLTPNKAKTLYLAICFLNQFNVPVRAGIISRRFGISFEDFREKFFEPLEDVVVTNPPKGVEDTSYAARHPHIAEIVVRNELSSVDDLFDEYLAALQELNVGYSTDKRALHRLVQGRRIAELFPDAPTAYRLFDAAEDALGKEDPYLLQQMAIYEMNKPAGNLGKAATLLDEAIGNAPRSRIIKHTLAELHLKRSEQGRNDLERLRAISKAEDVCRDLKRDAKDSYAHTTMLKAGLLRLKRAAESEEVLRTEDIEGLIKSVEKDLREGQQRFPGDSHLLAMEANLAEVLSDSDRFEVALAASFKKNPRNGYVAWQLAKVYERKDQTDKAQRVLLDALDANRNNPRLHLSYGKLLLKYDRGTTGDRLYHFKHAFTPGDKNYEAQLLYGRQLFVDRNFNDAREVFSELSKARLPGSVKRTHSYPLDGQFAGVVDRSEAWYCIIRRDGDGAMINFDEDDSGQTEWREIGRNTKVRFRIAFTMFGPEAFDVEIM